MTLLYRHNGAAPAPIPAIAYDDAGNAYTPPYADADLAALGFVIAPPRPYDTDTQTAEWDPAAEAWVMVDRPPPPPPSTADVDVERDRRIAAPFAFSWEDAAGETIQATFQADETSRGRIERARLSALAAIAAGAQRGDLQWHGLPVDFVWIGADNGRWPMDARTVVDFGSALAAREGVLILAASDLKARIEDGETIADVTEDALWPA